MNSNTPQQIVTTGNPIVARTVLIPPVTRVSITGGATNGWSSNAYQTLICILVNFLTILAVVLLISGCNSILSTGNIQDSWPIFFGFTLIFVAACLWHNKGCRKASPGRVMGPTQGATQTVGVPVVGQVVNYPTTSAAGQVVNYPTTPAACSVPGGLVSTYTYTPPNQPSPAQRPAPTYPSPGQVPAPANPYVGGKAPSCLMDQKPPVGAPVGTHVGAPVGASDTGFQAPPTPPPPYLPEYQAPPPYDPDEKPPPYSE